MHWRRSDLTVGLVLLSVLALVGVALVATVPRFRARGHRLVFQVEGLYRLEVGAPVLVDGYRVGQVRSIDPVAVPGGLEFQVTVAVRRKLSSGLLELREGTHVEIASDALLSPPVVLLYPSPDPAAPLLADAGIVPARIGPVAGEALGRRMPGLIDQLDQALAGVPELLARLEETFASARAASDSATALMQELHATTSTLTTDAQRALARAEQAMIGVEGLRARAGESMDTVMERTLATMDTVAAAVDGASRLIAELRAMRADLEPGVQQILLDLEETTLTLNHLVRAIAERPLRLFTGVKIPGAPEATDPATRTPPR